MRYVRVDFGTVSVKEAEKWIDFMDGEYDRTPHDAAFLDVANAFRRALGRPPRNNDHAKHITLVRGSSFGPYYSEKSK